MRICAILLLAVAICCAGCGPKDEDPRGYWYNPDKLLTIAVHDCRECLHNARFQGGARSVSATQQAIFEECMHTKGYRRVKEDTLDPGTETIELPALGGTEPVAGKPARN